MTWCALVSFILKTSPKELAETVLVKRSTMEFISKIFGLKNLNILARRGDISINPIHIAIMIKFSTLKKNCNSKISTPHLQTIPTSVTIPERSSSLTKLFTT